jgi:hypothetical protein
MLPWVLRMTGDTPIRLLVSPSHVFRIGRDTEADLCLDDKLVSRRHAELEVIEDGLELRDLGSRNGTRLNGKPLQGRRLLRVGDEVKIGAATLIVDGPQQPSDKKPSKNLALAAAPQEPPTGEQPRQPKDVLESQNGIALREIMAPTSGGDSDYQPPLPPDIRTSLPGFELVAELARGRTGVLYRAKSPDGSQAFVKILDTSWASSEHALSRFEAEARTIAQIDHPNIVRIGEIAAVASRYYYTMEVLDGLTLERMMKAAPLKPREGIALAAQVARGLSAAHALGTVHRDIAPASIFVTNEGVAKLFDFAFVKVQDNMPSLTNMGDVVGDLRYCSPEQAGNPRAVDQRSDVYSLGATLYHALAGRPPIEGKNYLDTYQRLVRDVPPPITELVPEVRPRLAAVLTRCLEKDMDKRFQDGAELAQALSEALLEAVIAARQAAPAAGVGIGADFHGVELLELVQVIAARHATGTLSVNADIGVDGEIRFRSGEIVGARLADETGTLKATNAVLDIRSGTFAFRGAPSVPDGPAGMTLRAADVALDALRRRSNLARPTPAIEEWGEKVG